MKTRRIATALACALGVIALATSASAGVDTPAAAPVAAVHVVADARADGYLQSARAITAGSNLDQMDDATLVAFGQNLCDAIDNGVTRDQLRTSAELLVVKASTYRALLALAEVTYCPEHIGVSF